MFHRLALVAATVQLAALALAAVAHATPNPAVINTIPKALHVGSRGQRVRNLQWLLSGHAPSAFRSVKTYRGRIDGVYGRRTALAVWNMKYRLGYPIGNVNKVAGFQLVQLLMHRQTRPIQWIAVAAKRQARVAHPVYKSQVSACQRRVVAAAESQVGVRETPWGSNSGLSVSRFQAVTGAYRAPWCVSFAQWSLHQAGAGPIADHTAGVFYMREWAYRRGLLRSKPEPGTIVLFLWSSGHAGVVVHVTQTGYDTVEGNYSNSVARVHHSFTRSAIAFVYVPGCS